MSNQINPESRIDKVVRADKMYTDNFGNVVMEWKIDHNRKPVTLDIIYPDMEPELLLL